MPDQNVIFQQPQGNSTTPAQNDPLDPFSKLQTPIPVPSTPIPSPPIQPTMPPPMTGIPTPPIVPTAQPNQSTIASPTSVSPLSQPNLQFGTPLPGAGSVPPVPPPPPQPPRPPSSSPLSLLLGLPLVAKIGIGVGVFFLLVIIIVALSSGGKTKNEKVTLTYWGLWENKSIMDQLFADFHKQYPNITVDVSEEDPKQYSDRLLTRIKNGTGPDLFAFHNSWLPEFSGVLAPLSTTAITNDEFTKSFYPVAQKDLIRNGAIYGIPLEIDTLALFINNTILKAMGLPAPQIWDEFTNIASSATVKDVNGKIKTSGAAIGTYDNITHASDIVAMLFAQQGANQTKLADTMTQSVGALNFYTSFGLPGATTVWDNTLSPSLIGFSQGNVAMMFGYSYDIFAIRVMNPALDFSIYPVPHLPNRSITVASYWVQGVSSASKHQKEAMLLMHFLAQKDTEEKLYALETKTRPFGEPYARVDLAPMLKNDPFVSPFVAQAPTAVSTYFSSNTYDNGINAQMNGYLGNAVRAVLANSSITSAVTTLGTGVTQILQQYGVQ